MEKSKLKYKIFRVISVKKENYLPAKIYETCIMILISINVMMVILETFSGLYSKFKAIFLIIEILSIIIFTMEYIFRIWTSSLLFPNISKAKARMKYLFSFIGIIDLIAILPFYLPYIIRLDFRVFRLLKLVRIMRIFKANRYINALTIVGKVLKSKAAQLLSSFGVVLMLMVVSSVLMYSAENRAQPEVFSNAFAGLWWAIATFTTVGYGDIFPITVMGKVLNSIMAILGIGLVAVPTGIISAGFVEHMEEEKHMLEGKKHYCPYCGEKLD